MAVDDAESTRGESIGCFLKCAYGCTHLLGSDLSLSYYLAPECVSASVYILSGSQSFVVMLQGLVGSIIELCTCASQEQSPRVESMGVGQLRRGMKGHGFRLL